MSLVGYSPWDSKESDVTEHLSTHKGNGVYSGGSVVKKTCLPMQKM